MTSFEYDPWLEHFIEVGQFAFDWDHWNRTKNWRKHGVTTQEAEESD